MTNINQIDLVKSLIDIGVEYSKDIKVYAKTNLGPELKIYDTSSKPSKIPSILKVGIRVEDRKGNTIASYGGQPKTDYILLAGIFGSIFGLSFIVYKLNKLK